MAWWSDWYTSASSAVGGTIAAVENSVSGLFKEPATGSIAYSPDDVSTSDRVRDRSAPLYTDQLFPIDAGPWPVNTDIQQAIVSRPKTWDEMSFWEKAKTYVGIVPGAVADTVGLGRVGAETPVSTVTKAGEVVADTAESVGSAAGRVVSTTVGGALGLPPGGLGSFLSSTLVKVILGLVVVVVGLYFVLRITGR